MEVLGNLYIPQLYEVVKRAQGYYGNPYTTKLYHVECGQALSAWFYQANKGGYYVDESTFYYCPKCGRQMGRNTLTNYISEGTEAPISMDFTLKEYKHFLDLECKYDVVFDTDGEGGQLCKASKVRKEVYRFDFKKRQALRKKHGGEWENLDPFSDWLPHYEALSSVDNSSTAQYYRRDCREFFKRFYEAFTRKLSTVVGYQIKNVYAPCSFQEGGFFAKRQMDTFIWKITVPDGPALTKEFMRMAYDTELVTILETQLLPAIREGAAYDKALLGIFCARPTKLKKSILLNKIGAARYIRVAEAITDNLDTQHALIPLLAAHGLENTAMLSDLIRHRGGAAAVAYLSRIEDFHDSLDARDTMRMYSELADKEGFWLEKAKPSEFHDRISQLLRLQTAVAKSKIVLPDYSSIYNDTVGGYDFVPPANADELSLISEHLNNCVHSYQNRIMRKEVAIVEVKQAGQSVACLEVRLPNMITAAPTLVQAKVNRNKPISDNADCAKAVLAWCKGHKLNVNCYDMEGVETA